VVNIAGMTVLANPRGWSVSSEYVVNIIGMGGQYGSESPDKYETGNIQLTNLSMKDKLITLFLCLKSLTGRATKKNKGGDSLFTDMDMNDIAQILRLHFAPYKGRKIDSVERRIYEVNTALKSDDPAYLELSKALQKFFFQ